MSYFMDFIVKHFEMHFMYERCSVNTFIIIIIIIIILFFYYYYKDNFFSISWMVLYCLWPSYDVTVGNVTAALHKP